MNIEQEMIQAHQDGYDARYDGKGSHSNPFMGEATKEIEYAWDAGWLQANQVIREVAEMTE